MFTALTQVSLTVLHRFTDTMLAQHNPVLQLQSPLHYIVHSHCDICTWWLAVTQLHDSCCLLALHATLCTSWILYSFLVGIFQEYHGSIYRSPPHSGRGMPGHVTSEASRVIMLLDAAAFCYNIIISPMKKSPDWYTSNSGSRFWFAYFSLFPSLFLYLSFLFLIIFFFVYLQHL